MSSRSLKTEASFIFIICAVLLLRARRYARAVYILSWCVHLSVRLSVWVSVCLLQVRVISKWRNLGSGFTDAFARVRDIVEILMRLPPTVTTNTSGLLTSAVLDQYVAMS